MKQKFMKKALAVALSTAMVFSASSVSGMQPASAAAKFVGLNTTFKTLKVGQKDYKLKLVNNTQGWKIKKVSTSDKKIATVYGKKASYVLLKGKSEGRATIKVSLKTNVRKKNNTKVLKCRVKVVGAGTATPTPSPDPTPAPTPSQASKTVATQAELTAALADTSLKSITVKTDSTASFTIPAGAHTSVGLTVDAPNADVTNSGVFKSITIAAIKDSTWTENAVGNNFKVDALKARIVVGTGASVTGVSVTKANADVAIVVNGKLASVTISAKAKLALSGSATDSVVVKVQAAGSEVTAEIPVAVEASADATIDLKAKAEKSTVKVTNAAATVTVKNNTTATIEITKPDNKVQKVSPKASATIKPSTSTGTGTGSYGGGTSSGSWGTPSNPGTSTNKDYAYVYTQDEMTAALKNPSLKTIEIRSKENGEAGDEHKIVIPDGEYNVDLIVNAPKKEIENSGYFKSIKIENIKPATWYEKSAKLNSFIVSAPNPRIVVEIGAMIKDILFGSGVNNAKLEVMGTVNSINCKAEGTEDVKPNLILDVQNSKAEVGEVSVDTSMYVTIKAETAIAEELKSKPIKVNLNAEAAVIASVAVDVKSTTDGASVVLGKGSEGSKIIVAEDVKEIDVKVEEGVTESVEVKTENSNVSTTVEPGEGGTVDTVDGGLTTLQPDQVTLTPNEINIDLNTDKITEELSLTMDPPAASSKDMTVVWSSGDNTIATVAKATDSELKATVTGVKGGTTTITALATTSEGKELSATCKVTVTDKTVTDSTKGLTEAKFTVTEVTVTTKAGVTPVTPAAIILDGVSATAKIDGSTNPTEFEFTFNQAENEKGITRVEQPVKGIEFTVNDTTQTTFNIIATATLENSEYTFTTTGTITINQNGDAFTAEIHLEPVPDQTSSSS